MATADSRPEKESFVLVVFAYGDGLLTQQRYTDWDQDYSGHTSTPDMALDVPSNDGLLSKNQLKIQLPEDTFTRRLSGGEPVSPTFVEVTEISAGLTPGEQTGVRILFSGQVQKATQNYQGKSGLVAIFSTRVKGRLDIPMGLQCNHQCAWNLFLGGCGASKVAFSTLSQIDSISGLVVTATDVALATAATGDDRFWKRGYLEKDGLRIAVRDYDGSTDVTLFFMAEAVPTDWIGGSSDITFVAGCDKLIVTCRSRFAQEETFMGLGFSIPPYQPNTESPS